MTVSAATTAGDILTSAYVNNNINSGLVYINSKTWASTSSAQQIDNCFTSEYDNYRLQFSAIGSATTSVNVLAQVVNGTSPVTTNDYYRSIMSGGTAAPAAAFSGSQSAWIVGLIGDTAASFVWDLQNPQAATKTTGTSTFMTSSTNDFLAGTCGQMILLTTQYEGISIAPASGTWAGTLTVFGYRKA